MSFRVQWSASGLDRLIGILDFIAQDNPAAARQVVDDLLAKVEVLAEHPRIGPIFSEEAGPNLRRLILGQYIVVYQIQEAKRLVSVIAVRHSRQRPLAMEDLATEL